MRRFFDDRWIDAPLRPGKRPGALLRVHRAEPPPLRAAQLDRQAARRRSRWPTSWATALHAYLARPQGVFHKGTPLTLAETASVFGETVTFGRLLADDRRPGRAPRAAGRVDRGLDRHRLPPDGHEPLRGRRAHATAASGASCRVDDFGELWAATQAAMLGDAVELTEGYRTWWSLHPALHRDARLRVRLRLRPAAGAVGVLPLRGPGRRLRAPLPRAAVRRRLAAARGARPHRRLRPRRPGVLGRRPAHRRGPARSGQPRGPRSGPPGEGPGGASETPGGPSGRKWRRWPTSPCTTTRTADRPRTPWPCSTSWASTTTSCST